jgi:hypothetical protein
MLCLQVLGNLTVVEKWRLPFAARAQPGVVDLVRMKFWGNFLTRHSHFNKPDRKCRSTHLLIHSPFCASMVVAGTSFDVFMRKSALKPLLMALVTSKWAILR